ncbi:MAG: signal peptide peptidase SppA [Candidatus Azobacteroides sp.]|nr:signal peptide peptidase SppA [Candidatus Azobacteroides sp.]
MRQFFKFVFASTLGVIIGSLLLAGIFLTIIVSSISFSKSNYIPEPKTILHLKLEGDLEERSQEDALKFLVGNYVNQGVTIGLDDILTAIENAKENPNIEGIYIECGIFSASVASVQEIRNALKSFKESNKFIIAYGGSMYLQNAYYLSSLADTIILNNQGNLFFKGLASQPVFYKNIMEKLGIEVEIFKVGAYKSAPERFSNEKMSEDSRIQVQDYLESVWGEMLRDISTDRNIPVDSLNSYADHLLTYRPASEAVRLNLVDTLMYGIDVLDLLKAKVGLKEEDKIKLAGISEVASIKRNLPKQKDKIAVMYAVNGIDDGSSNGVKSGILIKDLIKLRDNEDVKAVVLRINSPGGSAYGSEQIWNAIREVKAKKPVVVSMGDYAASGGYYIAAPANYIFAQPGTLTGSIGIYGIIPNLTGLYDKIGLSFDLVKTNRFSDMPSEKRKMTPEEKEMMQVYIENGYDLFLTRCAEGRNLSKDSVNRIAQGRVWTGIEALEIGLVDELGGLEKAIRKAAELSDTEIFAVVHYPEKKDFLSLLSGNLDESLEVYFAKKALGDNFRYFDFMKQLEAMPSVQARLPFELNIE